jgi:hypothetical protein
MTVSIHGWTGDAAGNVLHRRPNELIIQVQPSDAHVPELFQSFVAQEPPHEVLMFPRIKVECLDPKSVRGWVRNVRVLASTVVGLELVAMNFQRPEPGRDRPWGEGPNLFAVHLELIGHGHAQPNRTISTLALAHIDASLTTNEEYGVYEYLSLFDIATFTMKREAIPAYVGKK